MASGGLSYSGLVNYGAVTLPSVESWGTNMNILRDPPKSIMTRRIDKVGDTSSLTQEIDESWDRAKENILIYPRGVNPMVSVSYQNYGGSNGGANQAGHLTGLNNSFSTLRNSSTQAKSMSPIMEQGAYRPPVFTQEQLLPLSRQPRVWTSVKALASLPDYSKAVVCPGNCEETRETKNSILKVFSHPTYYDRRESNSIPTYTSKFHIQDMMHKEAFAHPTQQTDIIVQYVEQPTKNLVDNPLHAIASTNKIQPEKYV